MIKNKKSRLMLKLTIAAAMLMSAVIFVSCGENETDTPEPTQEETLSYEDSSTAHDEGTTSNVENVVVAPGDISIDQAKSIAVGKVPGSSDADIKKIKEDRDDGLRIYKGELNYRGDKYEFKIDAATGTVLEWEYDD